MDRVDVMAVMDRPAGRAGSTFWTPSMPSITSMKFIAAFCFLPRGHQSAAFVFSPAAGSCRTKGTSCTSTESVRWAGRASS